MTRRTLENRLRFHAHSIAVRIVPLSTEDGVLFLLFGARRIALRKGMRRKARLSTLLHELLHASCRLELPPWGDLEETVTEAVERDMLRYIYASKARLAWWSNYLDQITEAA